MPRLLDRLASSHLLTRLPLRARLTLWFAACLTLGFVAFGGGVYLVFRSYLLQEVDRALEEEISEVVLAVRRSAPADLQGHLAELFNEHGGYITQVTDDAGRVIFCSPPSATPLLPVASLVTASDASPSEARDWRIETLADLGPHRMVAERINGPGGVSIAAVGDSLVRLGEARSRLLMSLLAIGPLAAVISLAGGYWLSRRALLPVHRLTRTALTVTATDLHRRVPVGPARDEIGELAEAFNLMIARLEASFQEVRRFTADAAHELRTPLAVLRTGAEVALRVDDTDSRSRRALTDQLTEIHRLSALVDQLLFLCREDSCSITEPREPVRLDLLIEELCETLQPTADSRAVDLCCDEAAPCTVLAAPDRLRRLLLNPLDNALRYTPPGGSVTVRLEQCGGSAVVSIGDTGGGISAEHLPRVFDRFYRGEQSRNRRTGGSGLGLAISHAIAESLGGAITLSSIPGAGTTAAIQLPISESPPLREQPPPVTDAPEFVRTS